MQKIIKKYKIIKNKKADFLISFDMETENIEDLTLVTYYFDNNLKTLVINYWNNEVLVNNYIFDSMPKKTIKEILSKKIILLLENKELNYDNPEEGNFHYECLNQKII